MQIHNNYNMSSFKSLVLTDSFKNKVHEADVKTQCKVSEAQEQLENTRNWDLLISYENSKIIPTFVRKHDDKKYEVSSIKYIDGKEVYFNLKDTEEKTKKVGVLEFDSYGDARQAFLNINNLDGKLESQNSGYDCLDSIVSAAENVTLSFEKSKNLICD